MKIYTEDGQRLFTPEEAAEEINVHPDLIHEALYVYKQLPHLVVLGSPVVLENDLRLFARTRLRLVGPVGSGRE